jgi:hypothetical protein
MYLRTIAVIALMAALLMGCGNLPGTKGDQSQTTTRALSDAGPVTQFVATSATNKVDLSWTNPAQAIQAIKIMRKAGSYPANKDDGTQVYNGTSTAATDTTTNNYTEYFYSAYTVGESGNIAGPANSKSASCPIAPTCPTGYVLAPANAAVGAYCSFCIAKYEMRDVGGVAASQETGTAWHSITQDNARTKCTALGAAYHLMKNSERLAISRNIENLASNWSGGTVVSGSLSRGYSASTATGDAWQNGSGAANSTAACLYNTGANTCAATGNATKIRTASLSNGSVIWDFTGNLNEWIDWVENKTDIPTPYDGNTGAGYEFSAVTAGGTTPDSLWKSELNYNSSKGYGRYYGCGLCFSASTEASTSGNYQYGGLYGFEFRHTNYMFGPQTGFRCAYTP